MILGLLVATSVGIAQTPAAPSTSSPSGSVVAPAADVAPDSAPAAAPPGLGSVPVGLSIEPPEQIVRFRERLRAAGVEGPATELACRPFAEALSLCFTWDDGDARRYVSHAELASWGVDLDALEAAARARAVAVLGAGRPERTPVTDMDATYWLSMQGDGLDEAGWLAPERMVELVGAELRVAVPARDIFVAWQAGSDELDKVMAVGVLRIHEASDHPVTSKVYTWDADRQRWSVWGQAR